MDMCEGGGETCGADEFHATQITFMRFGSGTAHVYTVPLRVS